MSQTANIEELVRNVLPILTALGAGAGGAAFFNGLFTRRKVDAEAYTARLAEIAKREAEERLTDLILTRTRGEIEGLGKRLDDSIKRETETRNQINALHAAHQVCLSTGEELRARVTAQDEEIQRLREMIVSLGGVPNGHVDMDG